MSALLFSSTLALSLEGTDASSAWSRSSGAISSAYDAPDFGTPRSTKGVRRFGFGTRGGTVGVVVEHASRISDSTGSLAESWGVVDGAVESARTLDRYASTIDKAEADASQRMQLLARKYVHGEALNREAQARLFILQERVRKAFPQVTDEDFSALEKANLQAADDARSVATILDELGIK